MKNTDDEVFRIDGENHMDDNYGKMIWLDGNDEILPIKKDNNSEEDYDEIFTIDEYIVIITMK